MSRRFRFRLEPALRVRARREEELQIELSRAIAALAAQQERAHGAEATVEAELEELRGMMAAGASSHEIRFGNEELAFSRARASHEATTVEQLRVVADERRAELIGASQDRRALEKLEGRQRAEHRREEMRLEGLDLDEIANARAARRARRPEEAGAV